VSQAARFFFAGSSISADTATPFPALFNCVVGAPGAGVVLRDRVVLVGAGCGGPALDLAVGTARGRPSAGAVGAAALVALPAAVVGVVLVDVKGALAVVVGLAVGAARPVGRVCVCNGVLPVGLAGGGCCCRCAPAADFLAAPVVVVVVPLVLVASLVEGATVAALDSLARASSSAFRLTPATVLGGKGSSISNVRVWSFLGSLFMSTPVPAPVVAPILLLPKNVVTE
jgi:hypothetical protein